MMRLLWLRVESSKYHTYNSALLLDGGTKQYNNSYYQASYKGMAEHTHNVPTEKSSYPF